MSRFSDEISFYRTDILDRTSLDAVMAKSRPSIVFHLAAHHFIPFCNENPCDTLRVNVEGTHAVLSAAARNNSEVAVVASSGALYPSQDDALGEDIEPAPTDIYGLSKLMTEQVAQLISATTDLRCVAARLFNTYGAYETNPHLIPQIIECLHREPVVRLGNIHTKRDYIYVEDVAEMLYRLSRSAVERYTVANVGTGIEYSAEDIVSVIGELLHREIRIEVDRSRLRGVDKLHQRANIGRLEELTAARPLHSLAEGLQKLITHERLAISPAGATEVRETP